MSNAKVRARRRRRAKARKARVVYYDIESVIIQLGATAPPMPWTNMFSNVTVPLWVATLQKAPRTLRPIQQVVLDEAKALFESGAVYIPVWK
jgi:hypothetical protein